MARMPSPQIASPPTKNGMASVGASCVAPSARASVTPPRPKSSRSVCRSSRSRAPACSTACAYMAGPASAPPPSLSSAAVGSPPAAFPHDRRGGRAYAHNVSEPVDVILRDGATLRLRAPQPEDAEALFEFFTALSQRSLYLRFHGFPKL